MVKVRAKWNTCKPVIKHIVTATLPCISKRVPSTCRAYVDPSGGQAGGSKTKKKSKGKNSPTVVRHGKGFPSRNLFGFHSQTFTGVYQKMRKTKKRFNNKINARTKGKFLLDFMFDISRFPPIFHVQMGCYNNINESKSAPTFPRIHWMFILADKLSLLESIDGVAPQKVRSYFSASTHALKGFPRLFTQDPSSWVEVRE